MAGRPDAATISFTVNLPPEVIATYFEGLAKVEQSKRTFPSLPSLSIFAPLVPMAMELASPYLSAAKKAFDQGSRDALDKAAEAAKNAEKALANKNVADKSFLESTSSESEPAVDDHEEAEAPQAHEDVAAVPAVEVEAPAKHRPAYNEDDETATPTSSAPVASAPAAQPGQPAGMPDMANLMNTMGPVMQQFASAFGMGGAPAASPKAHKHTPTKKTSKKPAAAKGPIKPVPRSKVVTATKAKATVPEVPVESVPEPPKSTSSVEALNARLEELIDTEGVE